MAASHLTSENYADVARVALDLWRALEGGSMPAAPHNPPQAQKSLLRFQECLKAVAGESFDITKIT